MADDTRNIEGWSTELRRLGRAAIDLVFPPSCLHCGLPTDDEPLPSAQLQATLGRFDGARLAGIQLCGECLKQFCWQPPGACPCCAAVMPPLSNLCPQCVAGGFRFDRGLALGLYTGRLREAVLAMKHSAHEPLSLAVSRLLVEVLGEPLCRLEADVVVPVPMHWRRRLARGTNAPEIVAGAIGRKLKVVAASRLLVRARHTLQQTQLSPWQRQQNLRGAFRVRRSYDVDGASVLLVDDVLTTGTTCSEAARTLKNAGAARVDVVVVARAGTPPLLAGAAEQASKGTAPVPPASASL